MQWEYDSINPTSKTNDIMLLAADDDEKQLEISPFWYACVLGIFHVMVTWKPNPSPIRLDFLWVRWYGRAEGHRFGDKFSRLEKIGFITEDDDTPSFGFIDPLTVVRAIHLIPDFSSGKTDELLGHSPLARSSKNDESLDEDWEYFYVNKYVCPN